MDVNEAPTFDYEYDPDAATPQEDNPVTVTVEENSTELIGSPDDPDVDVTAGPQAICVRGDGPGS